MPYFSYFLPRYRMRCLLLTLFLTDIKRIGVSCSILPAPSRSLHFVRYPLPCKGICFCLQLRMRKWCWWGHTLYCQILQPTLSFILSTKLVEHCRIGGPLSSVAVVLDLWAVIDASCWSSTYWSLSFCWSTWTQRNKGKRENVFQYIVCIKNLYKMGEIFTIARML